MLKYLPKPLVNLGQRMISRYDGTHDMYKYARMTEKRMNLSLDEIHKEQFKKLKRIVSYAYQNSKFYNRKYKECGFRPEELKNLTDFKKVPPLKKREIRDFRDDFITVDYQKHDLIKSMSGGTTGLPVTFYRSQYAQLYRMGIDIALFRYFGWRDGDWQAWMWGASRDLVDISNFKTLLKYYWIGRRFYIDTLELTDKVYQKFINRINDLNPTLLSAYPSIAYDLASRIENGDVRASNQKIPVLSVTAEPLFEFQRKKIEMYLADKVYARYGAREFGTTSFECPRQNGYHLFYDSVYLETESSKIKDSSDEEILVTDLINEAMPLIRYEIGDFGKIDYYPCPCGLQSPRLYDIKGRTTNVIWRPDGSGCSGFHLMSLTAPVMINTKIQFVQDRIDRIIVNVEGSENTAAEDVNKIINILKEPLGRDINFQVRYIEKIERSESGKFEYFVSNVEKPK